MQSDASLVSAKGKPRRRVSARVSAGEYSHLSSMTVFIRKRHKYKPSYGRVAAQSIAVLAYINELATYEFSRLNAEI